MASRRVVSAETLDQLAADDPRARRSRRDLVRVNRFMGACGTLMAGLRLLPPERLAELARRGESLRILELGAGDGTLMLRIARKLSRAPSSPWRAVQLWLLDRQSLLTDRTRTGFARQGWSAQPLVIDVLQWAAAEPSGTDGSGRYDIIVANLFLHHLQDDELRRLFSAVAARCELFVSCEPRRSALALTGSRLLGVIGASAVTRHDGKLSVQAGFRDGELSALWPEPRWTLIERPAGAFAHVFTASRPMPRAH